MKKYSLFFVLLALTLSASAQKKDLLIRKSIYGLYIEHKVGSKESFFAIGRKYNVSPQSIALFNKLDLKDGLQIDQKLRVPLSDTNFLQKGNTGVPLYYTTDDKDHLADLSMKYNNVPIEQLKAWNNIDGDDVPPGTKLMVGFLIGSEFSAQTINAKKLNPKENNPTVSTIDEKPKVKPDTKPEVRPEEKQPLKTEPPVVKSDEKPIYTEQGYFKSHFDQQVRIIPASKMETVTSGIFKTASGWQDAKFYLLIDKVPPGTIIRVINPTNNKSVYAKVLGEMTGIRQNEGLNIRISNAAASALEISEQDKFIVNVNY